MMTKLLDLIYIWQEGIYMKKPSRWAAVVIFYFFLGMVLGHIL